MVAWPSRLTTGGVTAATPGVRSIAPRRPLNPECPFVTTISGASKPGPNPRAIVAWLAYPIVLRACADSSGMDSFMASAGAARMRMNAADTTVASTGCRWTTPAQRSAACFFWPERVVKTLPPRKVFSLDVRASLVPVKPSSAGSSVSEAMTVMATVTAAAIATPRLPGVAPGEVVLRRGPEPRPQCDERGHPGDPYQHGDPAMPIAGASQPPQRLRPS